MVERKLLIEKTRSYVKKNELFRALILASADLEQLFFTKLLFEKGIKHELMSNWTLGKYIEWVSKLGLIDKKYVNLLKDFNKTRNMIVHSRNIMNSIEQYPLKMDYLKNMILAVCDFIDNTPVSYETDQDMENEYWKFAEKMRRKYDNFIAEANRNRSE